jgi:hypothetical protein
MMQKNGMAAMLGMGNNTNSDDMNMNNMGNDHEDPFHEPPFYVYVSADNTVSLGA